MMVLRSANFRSPKKITDSDFDEICGTSKILSSHRLDMKKRLDALVEAFGESMRETRRQPARKPDRKRLERALSYVEKAAAQTDKLGPSGRLAMRTISDSVAPMLSAQWLNEKFSDDDFAPQRSQLPSTTGLRSPYHTPLRSQEYFIEEKSLEARFEFVQQRPVRTTSAVLREIKKGLATALRSLDLQPRSRGGREPLTYRHYLIMNLAEIWISFGRKVSTSAKSEFTTFCETVAEPMGWPTDGMSAAIPVAVRDWRNRAQKYGR
jgi:hypothetical protein